MDMLLRRFPGCGSGRTFDCHVTRRGWCGYFLECFEDDDFSGPESLWQDSILAGPEPNASHFLHRSSEARLDETQIIGRNECEDFKGRRDGMTFDPSQESCLGS